jgi:iron complex outermembrane recepter protein
VQRVFVVILFSFVALCGSSGVFAADEDAAIEEVIVTGSYLKRTAQDSPIPLSVLTAADIEDLGVADVAEIVRSMPWQSGSQTRAETFGGGEGSDGRNTINLRNLGHGSTLPLVNGKRQVASWYNARGNASVNVNGLIPNIALERIEVLKAGASALYGSDAIAGVVNFITKKDFEGFDFSYQYTTDDETGKGDANQMGILFGVQGDRGGIVASAEFLNRDEINIADNYDRFGATTISSTGQPGTFQAIGGQTPTWAANGLRPGLPVDRAIDGIGASGSASSLLPRDALGTSFGRSDVNCEDSAALEEGGALGVLTSIPLPLSSGVIPAFPVADRCIYDYGSFFSLQGEESLRKVHVDGHYDLTDTVELYFEFASNDSEFDRLNSLNPNAPALTIPTEVSYVDATGTVQTVPNPGSVEDAFRRGIEPLEYANLTRLIGGTRDTPRDQRPLDTFTESHRSDQRIVVGATMDFMIGDNEWVLDASYTASQHNTATTQAQDTLSTHMELALNGLGGPNCDTTTGVPGAGNAAYAASGGDFDAGDCYFFNPFGNSQFERDGSLGNSNLELDNPEGLYQWLLGRASSDSDFRQRVIDIVAAGDLLQTDSGPIGLAVGLQQRRDKGTVTVDSALTSDNLDFVFGARDWSGGLTTTAAFVEVAIPLGDMVELNIAGRYEDFDELGEDTFDPKFTLLFRPLDSLTLRASAGSSFRVPSLQQSFGSLTTVANQADLVGGTAFKPSLTVGNPDLTPESADNMNFGLSWVPTDGIFEGLSVDIDYYDYEYTDIITRESSPTLLAEDNAALSAYAAANLGGSCAALSDCYIDAVNAGVGNRAQIIRNSQAILLRILPNFTNANGADVSGVDLNTSYRFDTDIGTWRVGLQAAWLDEYSVEVPNSAGGVTTFDAVGNYNSTNPVARPLPEWKINGSLSWNMDNHRAFLLVKYVDEVESDIPAGTRGFFAATTALGGNGSLSNDFLDTKIESFTTVDVQYTYSFGEQFFLNDSSISLGIQNIADEEAPVVANVTASDGTLHDPRGRIFFVRVSGSM